MIVGVQGGLDKEMITNESFQKGLRDFFFQTNSDFRSSIDSFVAL